MSRKLNRKDIRKLAEKTAAEFVSSVIAYAPRGNPGGEALENTVALKVLARGFAKLFQMHGRPFATQVSEKEALAFGGLAPEPAGRFAIGFAIDGQGRPYATSPVCARPSRNYEGPPLSTVELVKCAERSAFAALFSEARSPHLPLA